MSFGKKYDNEKVPLHLVPNGPVWEIAKVLGFGAKKYDAWNWHKGIEYSRLLAAAQRHISQYESGIDVDKESGLSHISHALCMLMFLMQFILEEREDLDDRYPLAGGVTVDGTYKLCQKT